jgi:hypothetical protein
MKNLNDSKEIDMSYDKIVEQLRSDVLEVTFTKVNGETRTMPCTLLTSFMPSYTPSEATDIDQHSVNKTVIRAFAIDKQAWRSFRVDNVTNIEVLNG